MIKSKHISKSKPENHEHEEQWTIDSVGEPGKNRKVKILKCKENLH